MKNIYNTWHNVSVRESGGSKGQLTSNTTNNFDNIMQSGNTLAERTKKYREMDYSINISRGLDIIAEDVSSTNVSDNNIFGIDYTDTSKVTDAATDITKKTLQKWIRESELDYTFFSYSRLTVKYGFCFFLYGKNGQITFLPHDRFNGCVMKGVEVDYYLYDETGDYITENGETISSDDKPINSTTKELTKIYPHEMLRLRMDDSAFGKSHLDSLYRTWKQTILLEDAIIIYRIVRAPERRVFNIDVGRTPEHKIAAHLRKVKDSMQQRTSSDGNGGVMSSYDPHSMTEDYFLSVSGDGRGSRIDTLPAGDNLGKIEDLEFFTKSLVNGLRVPTSYIDFSGENDQSHNDGRVGVAFIAELRYAGMIQRIQRKFEKELFEYFMKFATHNEVELPEHIRLTIAPPQSFAAYNENELSNTLLNTYNSADSSEVLSKKENLRKFMNMDAAELNDNEEALLSERGISIEEAKSYPAHIRDNLIYGDGAKYEDYISASDNSDDDDDNSDDDDDVDPDE